MAGIDIKFGFILYVWGSSDMVSLLDEIVRKPKQKEYFNKIPLAIVII